MTKERRVDGKGHDKEDKGRKGRAAAYSAALSCGRGLLGATEYERVESLYLLLRSDEQGSSHE